MSGPSSLRDLYIDPSSAWSFVPTQQGSSVEPPAGGPSAPSYQWSARPSQNSIFELSPSLDLSEPTGIDVTLLLKALAASVVLQYSSVAVANPWEVGRILLQVQWVPRDAGEPEEPELVEDNNEDAVSDSEDESYFAEPHTALQTRHPAPRPTDEQGYILRRSILEEGTRPEYIIPVGSADGVWGMIKRVGRFRSEGWLALWKGTLTSCLNEILSTTMQPLIQNFLQSLFFPSLSPFHEPPIILPVVSHILTGVFLSPLDLIKTRLIVQSSSSRFRKYKGPLDALSQILRDEGGLKGIYFHPHLLVPAIIDHGLRPIVGIAIPSLFSSRIGLGVDSSPILWSLAGLTTNCIGLLISLPFEVIRRRLQVQVRGTAKPLNGCVELRPAPYNGMVDVFWHVLTEERSDLPIPRRDRKRRMSQASAARPEKEKDGNESDDEDPSEQSWLRHTGIGQLYRGFSTRLSAHAVVLCLSIFGMGVESDSGWTEI